MSLRTAREFVIVLARITEVKRMAVENRMVVDSEHRSAYKVVSQCNECEGDIYAGEYFYHIKGDAICENCIDNYVKEHFRRCIE